jgi:hypothetical protein
MDRNGWMDDEAGRVWLVKEFVSTARISGDILPYNRSHPGSRGFIPSISLRKHQETGVGQSIHCSMRLLSRPGVPVTVAAGSVPAQPFIGCIASRQIANAIIDRAGYHEGIFLLKECLSFSIS